MQEGNVQHSWTSTQVYVLSSVSLLIGIMTGYLLHVPARPATPVTATMMEQQALTTAVNVKVPLTPEQKKSEADKLAEPLLASLEKNPKDAALLAKIAAVYFSAHQFQTAQDYYARSAAFDSKDPAIFVKLSSAYFYGGDGEKAIAALNQALDIDSQNADALFNIGVLQWQVNNNPRAAIANWQKLLKAHPDHPHRVQVEQMIARAKMHMSITAAQSDGKPTP